MSKTNLNKLLSYLTLVFPASLIAGPLIPEIILGLVSIIVNYQIIRSKKFFYYNSKFSIFFLVFWAYLLLNSLLTENIIWSLKTSVFYFRYYIFSIAIFYLIENDYLDLKKLLLSLFITFIILIIDLFIQYNIGKNLLGFPNVKGRYSGLFGDELILGSYLNKFYPLLVSLIYLKIHKNKFLNIFILSPIVFLAIVITGERTASILCLIFIFFISFILIDKSTHKIIYTLSLVLIFSIFIQYNPKIKDRFINDTLNLMLSEKYEKFFQNKTMKYTEENKEKVYLVSVIHHGHYLSAYKLFLEKPIFGNGVNSFRNNCSKFKHKYKCSTHPHNIPIQILSEIGIVGLFFYVLIIIFFIKGIIHKKNSMNLKILSIGMILYIFPFAPSGNFFNNWMNMIFYFLVGFYFAFMRYNLKLNDK